MNNKFEQELIKKEEQLANYDGEDKIVSSEEIKEQIEKEPLNPVRIKTGFKYLDSYLGQIEGGEMIAITGKTKRGKSLFIKSMLSNLSENGQRAVIFQYEIPYRRYFESWGENVPLFYLPKHLRNRTSQWLEERVMEAKIKYNINVVVIDPYNKLVNYEQRQSPTVQASAIVGNLKDICTTHNIIMFVISHASRMAEGTALNENMFRDTHILPSESDRSWIIDRVVDKQTKQFTNETKVIISLDRWEGSAMGKIVTFEYKDGLLYEKDLLGEPETQLQETKPDELPF